jgi:L-cysteine/cystine lyase
MRNGLPSIPSIPTAIRSVDSGHVFDVESVRQDMPSVRASAYFNAGTFGPLPRAADDAMRAHMNASFERGRTRLDDWFLLQEEARRAFARTLFAHVDAVALMHCTTDAINTVISGLTFDDGDEIVTTTDEHPGVTAPLEELARRHRIAVHVVEPRAEAIVKAIGERTRLIAISHVLWTTGDVLPVAEIAAAAREYGALVLVDGAQAVGAIDVDPENLGADFYAASGQKWLCGPSGTGALWIRPAMLDRLRTPWPWYLSKSRGPSGVRDWGTARRLDATTLSMTSLSGLIAALDWHRAQVSNGALTWAATLARSLRDELDTLPRVLVVPATTPSTIVSFTVSGERAAHVAQRLEDANVFVRSVPSHGYVRASVGFWNNRADLDALVCALG